MKVLHLGESLLREKSLPVQAVTDEIRQLIDQMFIVMNNESGIGLAAPQVGQLLRLFIVRSDDEINRVFINPQVIFTSPEMVPYEEGCLSIPKLYEEIMRPKAITIQALNEKGRPFTLEADGLLARVIQHEYDHLEGVLYIDRGDPEFKTKAEELFARRAQRRAEKEAQKLAKENKSVGQS